MYDPQKEAHRLTVEEFREIGAKLDKVGVVGIVITGGEPFLREDFFELLELLAGNKRYFDFSILTNGTLK